MPLLRQLPTAAGRQGPKQGRAGKGGSRPSSAVCSSAGALAQQRRTLVCEWCNLPGSAALLADELVYEEGFTTSIERDGHSATVAATALGAGADDGDGDGDGGEEVFQGLEGRRVWRRCKFVAFVQAATSTSVGGEGLGGAGGRGPSEEERVRGVLEGAARRVGLSEDTLALACLSIENLEKSSYSAWEDTARNTFEPLQVSPGMRIVPLEPDWRERERGGALGRPSGVEAAVTTDTHTVRSSVTDIFIEPGFAFGTGQHQTTQLCLRWLEGNRDEVRGKAVVDYGSGSGILAVGSLLLGARSVLATDVEEESIFAIELNVGCNAIQRGALCPVLVDHQQVLRGECEALRDVRTECLLANILLKPLLELEQTFAELVASPGGKIVLSGILATQVPQVREAYGEHFAHFSEAHEGEWALVTAVRK